MSTIDVYLEVGKVKKILVSRPELYFDAVRPDSREFQLVDDVVWLAKTTMCSLSTCVTMGQRWYTWRTCSSARWEMRRIVASSWTST